jgi:hypothetical protein
MPVFGPIARRQYAFGRTHGLDVHDNGPTATARVSR